MCSCGQRSEGILIIPGIKTATVEEGRERERERALELQLSLILVMAVGLLPNKEVINENVHISSTTPPMRFPRHSL